ncbi:F-box/kelch-repeat protein At3g06240-like [Lotus japonicus]|uniref:F-box/kelch-repeat protein At3g06240-like n=1 Tax=Lotus japonicus TaxID=34305 RepID=UPI002586C786|nr:F-box/kelch-repeat protein At3g06240-like [Lotus japonicus]
MAEFTAGLFLNQSLHWMAKPKATGIPVVLAFNLIDRSLSEIPLSPVCVELYESRIGLGCIGRYLRVLGGCLSMYYRGGDHAADEIWVMEKYKVPSSWTRSFVLPPNTSYNTNKKRFWPLCYTKGGALLASSVQNSSRLGTILKLNENGQVLDLP